MYPIFNSKINNDKPILLIGNSPCVTNNELGRHINLDNFNIIRFNLCKIKGYEKYVGSGTSYFIINGITWNNTRNKVPKENILISELPHTPHYKILTNNPTKLRFKRGRGRRRRRRRRRRLPPRRRSLLLLLLGGLSLQRRCRRGRRRRRTCRALAGSAGPIKAEGFKSVQILPNYSKKYLKEYPTSGMMAISFFLQFYNHIYLYGFSFNDSHYYDSNFKKGAGHHNYQKEKIVISELEKKNLVTFINPTNILTIFQGLPL